MAVKVKKDYIYYMNDDLDYLFGDVYFFVNDAKSTKCSELSSGEREWNQPQSFVDKVTIPGLGLPGLPGLLELLGLPRFLGSPRGSITDGQKNLGESW